MSQQPRELESYFQEIGAAHSAEESHDGSAEDFNTFFERLSSIDDLTWNDGAAAEADPGRAAHEPEDVVARMEADPDFDPRVAPPRREAPARKRSAPRHMTVVHSDEVGGDHPPAGASAGPAPGASAAPAPSVWETAADEPMDDGVVDTGRLGTILKVALAGTAFFAVGLLGGWLALSLPEQGTEKPVNLERRLATAEQRAQPSTATLQPPPTPPEKEAEQAVAASGKQTAQPDTASATDAVSAETTAARPEAPQAPAPQASAPTDEPGGQQVAARNGDFALQVGACSSYGCVQRYRELLLTHVASDAIRIHKQTTDAGTIQRVRVEPLSRNRAQQLKRKLAAADKRLGNAYVVSLP